MEMTRISSPVLGRAIFGTIDGLQARGTGILAAGTPISEIFEFGIGRSRTRPLHQLTRDHVVYFRRACITDRGEHVELIGCLAPCLDRLGRHGFFGACTCIPGDRIVPDVAIHDWEQPLQSAMALIEEIEPNLGPDGSLKGLSAESLRRSQSDDPDARLQIAGSGEEHFEALSTGATSPEGLNLLQGVAFTSGDIPSTLLVFEEPIEGGKRLDSNSNKAMLAKMFEKVSRRQREHAQKRTDWARRPGEMNTDMLASVGRPRSAGKGKGMSERDLETRVRQLEHEVRFLMGTIEQERAGYSSQPRSRQEQMSSGLGTRSIFDDPSPSMTRRLLPWVGGSLVLLLLCGGLIWFLMTPGGGAEGEPGEEQASAVEAGPAKEGSVATEPAGTAPEAR